MKNDCIFSAQWKNNRLFLLFVLAQGAQILRVNRSTLIDLINSQHVIYGIHFRLHVYQCGILKHIRPCRVECGALEKRVVEMLTAKSYKIHLIIGLSMGRCLCFVALSKSSQSSDLSSIISMIFTQNPMNENKWSIQMQKRDGERKKKESEKRSTRRLLRII